MPPTRHKVFFPVLLLALYIDISGAAASKPYYIESITTDSELFNISIATFTPTKSDELLQQYLSTNLRKNQGRFGAFHDVFERYISERLTGPKSLRIKKLIEWTKDLKPDDQLSTDAIERACLYLKIRELSFDTAPLNSTDPRVTKLVAGLNSFVAEHDKDCWAYFLQALANQVLNTRGLDKRFAGTTMALIGKASLLATKDAHLHYILGRLFIKVLDPDDVADYVKMVTAELEKSLLLQPSNRELFTRITGIYVDIHEKYQARGISEPFWFEELVYKRIIALDPTNAQAHNNLSYLYTTYGINLKQALREARIAAQLKPDDPAMLDTLGWAYYRTGQLTDALKVLKKAVAADPSMADIHFHLASVYYDLDQFDPTVRHFRQAIRLDEHNAFARNNLAYFLAEKNRKVDEALKLVDQALSISPDNAAFLDTKGWILYRLGRYEEAIPFIKKALSLSPDTSELHLHLGQVYLGSKRFEDAIKAFEHALAYDPKNKDIALRLSRLIALHSLENGMKTFARISGVKENKDNFRIFFDLMAQVHMADGRYEQAAQLMNEYHLLKSGEFPPSLSTDGTSRGAVPSTAPVKTTTTVTENLSAEGVIWNRLSCYLSPSNRLLVGFKSGGVLKLVDIFLQKQRLPVPAQILRGLIATRLPERVLLGLDFDKTVRTGNFVLAMQFTPEAAQALRGRLAELNGNSVDIPTSTSKVDFSQNAYKGLMMGRISTRYGNVSYLFPRDDIALLTLDTPHLVRLADSLDAQSGLRPPGFAAARGWLRLMSALPDNFDFLSFFNVPPLEKIRKDRLSANLVRLLSGTRTFGTRYDILDDGTLRETTIIEPVENTSPVELMQLLRPVLDELKNQLMTATGQAIEGDSSFSLTDGWVRGTINLKSFSQGLAKLLSRLETMGLPTLVPAERRKKGSKQ